MVLDIKIIKKSLDNPLPDKPINFPPLENLHLELIENKRKIRKDLPPLPVVKRAPIKINDESESNSDKENRRKRRKEKRDKKRKRLKEKGKKKRVKISTPDASDAGASVAEASATEVDPVVLAFVDDNVSPKKSYSGDITRSEEDESVGASSVGASSVASASGATASTSGKNSKGSKQSSNGYSKDASEDSEESEEESSKHDYSVEESDETEDIYAGLTPEEREIKEKEEYIWRFHILRKKYPKRSIPKFNEFDDLSNMKITYERVLKDLTLDKNIDSYKTYLFTGFIGVEFLMVNMMGMSDMKGFAAAQKKAKEKYDELLVELGERSYSSFGSNWPVEIRLLILVAWQAGTFFIAKKMSDSFGGDAADFWNNAPTDDESPREPAGYGQSEDAYEDVKSSPPQNRPKMKGPSVKIEDLRKNYGMNQKKGGSKKPEEGSGSEESDDDFKEKTD